MAPGWWHRQHDPGSSLYLPTPLAGRNRLEVGWSLISTVERCGAAALDRRGALALPGATWLLDWWFNHDGTWRRAAAEGGVRQHRAQGLPVAETRVAVGAGELVLRHGAVPRSGSPGAAWATLQIEVDGPDPVGLALLAVPWTLMGPGRIDEVAVEGSVLSVDGVEALVAERPPRSVLVAERADELASALAQAPEDPPPGGQVGCRSVGGTAGAALVWPMAHRTSLSVALPLGFASDHPAEAPGAGSGLPVVPPADSLVAGWNLHLDAGAAFELPDPATSQAARAARAQLLAAATGSWFAGATPDVAALACSALARAGHAEAVTDVVAAVAEAADDDPPGLLAVLEACVGVGLGCGADDVTRSPEAVLVHLARALHVIDRNLRRHGAEWWPFGGRVQLVRLVAAAAVLADGWGQPGVADTARSVLEVVGSDLSSESPNGAEEGAAEPGPAEPQVRWVRRAPGSDLDLPATLAAARRDIASGNPRGAATVAAVAALLARLECWPDAVHPTRPLGVGEDGASVATMASLLAAALDLAVPLGGAGVEVFPAYPPQWWGRPAQFSGLPVPGGSVSVALRWHGARPALLWELAPADPGDRAESSVAAAWPEARPLRAPGLDQGFAATGGAGEALLALPPGADALLAMRAQQAARVDGDAQPLADAADQPSGEGDDAASASEEGTAGGVTMSVGIPTRRRSHDA